jgi:hypothetical protein
MPLYLLSVCYPEGAQAPPPEELARIMVEVGVVRDELVECGAWVFGGGMQDASSAVVVSHRDGEPVRTPGQFLDSDRQIGGFTVIEVADLDEALGWAERQSRAITTPIEVRALVHGGSG